MSLPMLYKKNSHGKTQQWSIRVDGDCVVTEYGLVGGKLQTTRRQCVAKNVGRSNARTAEQQAEFEANSKWKEQQTKHLYAPTEPIASPTATTDFDFRPMLAESFSKIKNLPEEMACQAKLDGVRCMTYEKDGNIVCVSRNNKEYSFLTTIKKESEKLLKALEAKIGKCGLDGELYNHSLGFDKIISIVRKTKTEEKEQELIQFWVFDINTPKKMTFKERWELLAEYLPVVDISSEHHQESLLLLPYSKCKNIDDFKVLHNKYVELGYEGLIIRNANACYQNKRTKDIIKYKEFFDEEATIIGAEEGEGNESGCVIWLLKDKEGREFKARPRGTRELRKEQYQQRDTYIGKQFTYRYQEKTKDGIPRFPVGIGFATGNVRDYE